MNYLDIPVPNRTQHLWRYTPWSKVHPTSVDSVPKIPSSKVTVNDVEIRTNTTRKISSIKDISRVFLQESNNSMHLIKVSDTSPANLLEISSNEEQSICHIHVECTTSGSLIVKLSGSTNWLGLHITGKVAKNCTLSFGLVNDLSKQCTILRCEDWSLLRDSMLEYGELSIGGSRIKNDIRTSLDEVNSSLKQNIAVITDGSRHDDHHIEILHRSGFTNSSLNVSSACSGKGHTIGTGLLMIEENCDGCDAGQVFKNLLLSDTAKAESIPELEVLSDDVKAAHGAASSSVDREQIHYLMSRGFPKEQAESLIVEGFLVSCFAKIKNNDVRQYLIGALTANYS
jgi:Fe-S cluster assembly protein SufD